MNEPEGVFEALARMLAAAEEQKAKAGQAPAKQAPATHGAIAGALGRKNQPPVLALGAPKPFPGLTKQSQPPLKEFVEAGKGARPKANPFAPLKPGAKHSKAHEVRAMRAVSAAQGLLAMGYRLPRAVSERPTSITELEQLERWVQGALAGESEADQEARVTREIATKAKGHIENSFSEGIRKMLSGAYRQVGEPLMFAADPANTSGLRQDQRVKASGALGQALTGVAPGLGQFLASAEVIQLLSDRRIGADEKIRALTAQATLSLAPSLVGHAVSTIRKVVTSLEDPAFRSKIVARGTVSRGPEAIEDPGFAQVLQAAGLTDAQALAAKFGVGQVAAWAEREMPRVYQQARMKWERANAVPTGALRQAESLLRAPILPRVTTLGQAGRALQSQLPSILPKGVSLKSVPESTFKAAVKQHTQAELHAWLARRAENDTPYVGFYTTDIQQSNHILRDWAKETHGRDLTRSEIALFHLMGSMASPQKTPLFDSSVGLKLFDRYLRTGDISPFVAAGNRWVKAGKANYETPLPRADASGRPYLTKPTKEYEANALKRVSQLVETMGLDGAMTWLTSKHPFKEVQAKFPGLKLSEYAGKDDQVFGMFGITGAKLGSYTLNRMGILDTVTKDMWVARTLGRWFGELVGPGGTVVKEPWSIGTARNRELRKWLDDAWTEVGDEMGMRPAEVQQAMWDAEKMLYTDQGVSEPGAYVSQGVKAGREALARGEQYASVQDLQNAFDTATGQRYNDKWGRFSALDEHRRSLRSEYRGKAQSGRSGDLAPGFPGSGNHAAFERRGRGGTERNGRLALPSGASHDVHIRATYTAKPSFSQAVTRYNRGIPIQGVTFHELLPDSRGVKAYYDAITYAKAHHPYGASVYRYEPAEYAKMRLFLSEDGTTGFALKPPTGDLVGYDAVSGFSIHGPDHAAQSIVQLAGDLGARRTDAFDTVLPDIYSDAGFVTVARQKWDDNYAPTDWDKARFARHNGGEPDVVYMVYRPDKAAPYMPGVGKQVKSYEEAVKLQNRAAALAMKTNPVLLKQRGGRGVQGYYDPATNVIGLLEGKADFSTVLHETAHWWEQFLQRHETWGETFRKHYGDVSDVQGSERFARHLEAYFRSGKAPTPELGRVFEAIKGWMQAIYAHWKHGAPPAEIKRLFDETFGKRAGWVREIVGEFERSGRG